MGLGSIPQDLLQEPDGELALAPERYKGHLQAQEDCNAMVAADRGRAWKRGRIDNVLNGNPLYPKSQLKKKGFGWMPRGNFLEMEGLVQAQATPLYDLVTEVDHCIEVTLDLPKNTQGEVDNFEEKIQTHFTWLRHVRWRKSWNFHLGMQQHQFLVHGLGTHIKLDPKSWMIRTPRMGQILFPDNAPLDFNVEGERFMLRDFVPAHTAYNFVKNEKAAKAQGWNPKQVLKALAHGTANTKGMRAGNTEDVLREMRQGDLGYTASRDAGFWINYLFVRELDTGKISQYAVCENYDPGDYLFRKRNRFKDWDEILSIFNFDIGDGTLHGVRGYGERTREFFEISNRLKNAMIAQVLIGAFPQIRQMQPNLDPDKLKLARFNALSILPYGVEPAVTQFAPLGNGPLALSDHLKQTLGQNNQSVTGATPEPKDRETATSFSMRSQDAARVGNGMQNLYESNLQKFDEQQYWGVVNTPRGSRPDQMMATEFKDRCLKDGITDDILRAVVEVREVTSSGSGSAAARLHGLIMLMQYVFPNTTEPRKINILRDLTANSMGGSKVDRYAPSQTDNEMPTEDDSVATLESGSLAIGGEAQVSGQQNDVKHVQNHLAKGQHIAEMVQQDQMPPEQAAAGLRKLLDHVGQHLARLQGNPTRKAEFDQLYEQFVELAKFLKQLEAQIEQQANQPNPEEQISDDLKTGLAKIQSDSIVKNRKADADIALKVRKSAFNERIKSVETVSKMNREAQKPKSNGTKP